MAFEPSDSGRERDMRVEIGHDDLDLPALLIVRGTPCHHDVLPVGTRTSGIEDEEHRLGGHARHEASDVGDGEGGPIRPHPLERLSGVRADAREGTVDIEVSPRVVQVRLRVAERRAVVEGAVQSPTVSSHRPVQPGDVLGSHEHVDVAAPAGHRPQRGIDRDALDMQKVGPDRVGEVLNGGVPESQAHRERHADL